MAALCFFYTFALLLHIGWGRGALWSVNGGGPGLLAGILATLAVAIRDLLAIRRERIEASRTGGTVGQDGGVQWWDGWLEGRRKRIEEWDETVESLVRLLLGLNEQSHERPRERLFVVGGTLPASHARTTVNDMESRLQASVLPWDTNNNQEQQHRPRL